MSAISKLCAAIDLYRPCGHGTSRKLRLKAHASGRSFSVTVSKRTDVSAYTILFKSKLIRVILSPIYIFKCSLLKYTMTLSLFLFRFVETPIIIENGGPEERGELCPFVLSTCPALTTAYSNEFYKLPDLQIGFSSDPIPFTTKMPISLCNYPAV